MIITYCGATGTEIEKEKQGDDEMDKPYECITSFHHGVETGNRQELVRCKDCRWFDRKSKESKYGYCHACKHGHYSEHWEIRIYRIYHEDFFCADGERK